MVYNEDMLNRMQSPQVDNMLKSVRKKEKMPEKELDPTGSISNLFTEVSKRAESVDYQPRPAGSLTREKRDEMRSTLERKHAERQRKEQYEQQQRERESWAKQRQAQGVDYTFPSTGESAGKILTQPQQLGYFNTSDFASKGDGSIKVSSTLIQKLNQLREYLGVPVYVTSGYRDPAHNASIRGAAPNSRHTTGEAADIWADGISMQELARAAEKFFGGGGIGTYGSHIHVDVGPQRRW